MDEDYFIEGVSPSEAVLMLGVTREHVSQVIRDGVLSTYEQAGERVVDLASIDAHLAAPRSTDCPRKAASLELTTVQQERWQR